VQSDLRSGEEGMEPSGITHTHTHTHTTHPDRATHTHTHTHTHTRTHTHTHPHTHTHSHSLIHSTMRFQSAYRPVRNTIPSSSIFYFPETVSFFRPSCTPLTVCESAP